MSEVRRYRNKWSGWTIVAIILVGAFSGAGVSAQQESDDATNFVAWVLGSKLSLAALGHAEGASAEVVNGILAGIEPAAEFFGTNIPPLPAKTGRSAEDRAAVLYYLLNSASDTIVEAISREYPNEPALLFEIALKSNLLLMLYAPADDISATIADLIRDRAPAAGIPQQYWRPVVNSVEAGASFEEVKADVVAMHENIAMYLSPN